MKLIVAIVRPSVLDRLVVALEDMDGFPGLTVTDTVGFGQRVKTPEDAINPFRPSKRIEIVAEHTFVDGIISVLKEHAHTGRKGDGFVIVLDIESSGLI